MSKPATSRSRTAPEEPSYERALEELERLVAGMEGQQLPLDQLLESYRRGADGLASFNVAGSMGSTMEASIHKQKGSIRLGL
jgi:acyl CoA:acetate/3-ketoacid CoA transferase alpha subunit